MARKARKKTPRMTIALARKREQKACGRKPGTKKFMSAACGKASHDLEVTVWRVQKHAKASRKRR